MTEPPGVAEFGARVARLRKMRGLSQTDLARAISRSESWVSQVERGQIKVDRVSVLQSLADVLEVPVAELRGLPVEGEAMEAGDATLDGIRLALTGYPALVDMLGVRADGEVPALDDLERDVTGIWDLAHASQFEEIGARLARVIPALERRARHADAGARDHELLAQVYQVTAAVLARQDERAAAWVASDRAIAAAARSGQPLEVVAGTFRLAHTLLRVEHMRQAEHAAFEAIRALQPLVDDGSLTVEGKSLYGALLLVLAVISARESNRNATHEYLDRAREMATQVGPGRNDFGTEFGPTNVTIHAVTTAVDLGDAGMALSIADELDVSKLSSERRARLELDKARAHAQRRQVGEAVAALRMAEELTPEYIQTHPLVRQTIRDLMQISRHTPPELLDLAERVAAL
ncbi:helix-turn-helix domain-containing protein [Promicromonospora sukumoe]|uniref:helix-turn-helix domain-containing protein n=1 Tax=Promicromonospora sukumoe TaxID=88382 RepID=UPI0037C5F36A